MILNALWGCNNAAKLIFFLFFTYIAGMSGMEYRNVSRPLYIQFNKELMVSSLKSYIYVEQYLIGKNYGMQWENE